MAMRIRRSLLCGIAVFGAAAGAVWAQDARISSAYYTKWKAGLAQLMKSSNAYVAQRALADVAEAGSRLPESEREVALRFLRTAVRQGNRKEAAGFLRLFDTSLDERRTALFGELERLPWTGGIRGLTGDLLQDITAQPAIYDSETLLLGAFVETCRQQQIPVETVEALAKAYGADPAGAVDALCLASRIHPAAAERWAGILQERFGREADALRLAGVYSRLGRSAWDEIPKARELLQHNAAAWLYDNAAPDGWAKVERPVFHQMVKASGTAPEAWEKRLAEAMVAKPDPALRACLGALIAWHERPDVSYRSLEPLLAAHQGLFCDLHAPESGGQSVMDQLNAVEGNRTSSRKILATFLAPGREAAWDSRLADILKNYYSAAASRSEASVCDALFSNAVAPIVRARFDAGFDPARPRPPIRAFLCSQISAADCFLEPRHQREAALWHMERLDWEAPVARTDGSTPNYRFTADALQALGQRRAGQGAARTDVIAQVADMARWVDWMLRGGMERESLRLGTDEVDGALRGICRSWTELKKRHGLSREELALGNLFAGLMKELGESVAAARTAGLTDDAAGRQRRDRVVRAVRLTLTISALIEDDGQLPAVLDLMRERLFSLPAGGPPVLKVRPTAELRAMVGLFRALDEDLGECLRNLSEARDCTEPMREVLRSFAERYHREIQLALVPTDSFLSVLQGEDARMTPYRRYLQGGPGAHPCALAPERVRASLATLTNTLDSCGFVNGESALAELLGLYRERLDLSFWRTPWACGSNANVGMPLLFRLLRAEKTPSLSPGEEPGRPLSAVVDALLDALGGTQSRLLTRRVEYNADGTVARTELYPARAFLKRADLLLRAQELLAYPVLGESGPVPVQPQVDALAAAAVSESMDGAVPGIGLPDGSAFQRRIDGTRRVRLCSVAQANTASLEDAIVAAESAVMLPNSETNAAVPGAIGRFDELRAAAFGKLRSAATAEPRSGVLADALIAMLRLDVCRRERGQPLGAEALVAELSRNLPPAGRWRVMVETWSMKHHARRGDKPRHCPQHGAAALECRACRDTVAVLVGDRADELADIRRFCQEQAGMPMPTGPKDPWEAIAQLSRSNQRRENVAEELAGIGPDTVKAAWYLLSQLKRVQETIPREWGNGWTSKLGTNEPLTLALVKVSSFTSATYGELLPICGSISMDALLGDGNRPANGDALAVFSVLSAESKGFLLEAAPLESILQGMGQEADTSIGALPTRDLVAIHSAMQPSIVAEVWRRGGHTVKDGGSLMQFVVEGKRYRESHFDADIVHEVEGSFSLSPRRLFDEAFRSVDLMVAAAGDQGGDDFVYNAWFGDLRRALTEHGLGGNEYLNMDTFLCSAAEIADDRRYEAPEMASVRGFAEAFQRDLKAWMDGGGSASMARLIGRARTPVVLTAVAERIGDRLGLARTGQISDGLERLDGKRSAAYGGFCRRALFDTSGGKPVFPEDGRRDFRAQFARGVSASNGVAEVRRRFLGLFEPYAGAHGETGFEGLGGLSRRAGAGGGDPAGRAFAGDFSHAYMHLASDIYWHGARDEAAGVGVSSNTATISFPWRLDKGGRPYIDVPLPEQGLGAGRLHTDSIRANLEWRTAAAERYRSIPYLCRFFGGDPTRPATATPEGK